MKSNEILKAFNLPKTKETSAHCSKLSAIYSLFKEIHADILTAEIVEQNVAFYIGKTSESKWENRQLVKHVLTAGYKVTGNKIKVTTKRGEYVLSLPTDNSFYSAVCTVIGLPFMEVAKENTSAPTKTVLVECGLFEAIKKAAKFVSKDNLRPAMTGVCLHFENDTLQVVATNAHYLYMSRKFECVSTDNNTFEIIISPESLQQFAKLKDSELTGTIDILPDNKAVINGVNVSLIDARFPDYKCVVPEYKDAMEFDRAKMIAAIKKVAVYANKSTSHVSFHLNGKVELSAQDIDFSFEGTAELPYISKTFPDMDIAFNGKLMNECLGVFKDKELKMYSNGSSTKAAIFTNGTDSALLMPLMLNS